MKVQVSTTIASPPYDGVKAGTTYQVRTTAAMGVTEGTGTVLEHLPDRTVFERRLGK